jgi:hypothetical protein
MEKQEYKGWPNCYRLANDLVDLIITADVGPRIIRFGFVGDDNEFKEYEDMLGKTGGDKWRIYGGHRLWHAPENDPRTYYPDNAPVQVEDHGDFVRTIQPVETTTGIGKEMDITLSPSKAEVRIVHRLRNTGLWTVELAPWSLSVMATGGRVIIPLPPRGSHPADLLPANTVTLWKFTDMSDPRWTWGEKYIMLRQDPERAVPQKVGALIPDRWAAYARNDHLFVKKFHYHAGAEYPDFGCTVETFTNDEMIELETLGPLVNLEPGATVEHIEHWFLFRDVPMPQSDADIDRDVLSKVESATPDV